MHPWGKRCSRWPSSGQCRPPRCPRWSGMGPKWSLQLFNIALCYESHFHCVPFYVVKKYLLYILTYLVRCPFHEVMELDVQIWLKAQMKACSTLMTNLVLVWPQSRALSEDGAGITLERCKDFSRLAVDFVLISWLSELCFWWKHNLRQMTRFNGSLLKISTICFL